MMFSLRMMMMLQNLLFPFIHSEGRGSSALREEQWPLTSDSRSVNFVISGLVEDELISLSFVLRFRKFSFWINSAEKVHDFLET